MLVRISAISLGGGQIRREEADVSAGELEVKSFQAGKRDSSFAPRAGGR